MTTQDDLTEAVGALAGLAGAANYALAGYQLTDESGPLERALEAIGNAHTAANQALDELEGQPDATVTQLNTQLNTQLRPEDEPA